MSIVISFSLQWMGFKFYVGKTTRLSLGFVGVTVIPVEIEKLLKRWAGLEYEMRKVRTERVNELGGR